MRIQPVQVMQSRYTLNKNSNLNQKANNTPQSKNSNIAFGKIVNVYHEDRALSYAIKQYGKEGLANFIKQVDRMSGDVPLKINMKTAEGWDWYMPLWLTITRDDQTFFEFKEYSKNPGYNERVKKVLDDAIDTLKGYFDLELYERIKQEVDIRNLEADEIKSLVDAYGEAHVKETLNKINESAGDYPITFQHVYYEKDHEKIPYLNIISEKSKKVMRSGVNSATTDVLEQLSNRKFMHDLVQGLHSGDAKPAIENTTQQT